MYLNKVTCHVDTVAPIQIEKEALQRMRPKDSDEPMAPLPLSNQSRDELVSFQIVLLLCSPIDTFYFILG